jgi:MoaA/NifB/PqqE/SkfB family radical SAM enzyme
MTASIRRTAKSLNRLYRETRMVALALRSPRHPVLAHMVVTRRCNLACTYCSEFDDFSKPVPTEELFKRIDKLAALGTTVITMTGGEPLLHPDLDRVIARIRSHRIIAILVTNGYLLNVERIQRLNHAGVDHMQISVDNVKPDDVSKKSLKVLDKRLQWLAEHAEFRVSIHSVLGACTENPEEAFTIAKRATELGLISTAGIVHDSAGQLKPLNPEQRDVLTRIDALKKKSKFSAAWHNPWRENLIRGLPNDWHCGAGGRHLYICEDGLVHYCMAQRGYPAIPLAKYTREDIERETKAKKDCAPYCTIFCIQRVALLDRIRENPRKALEEFFPSRDAHGNERKLPVPIRVLRSLLAPSGGRKNNLAQKTALKILKID